MLPPTGTLPGLAAPAADDAADGTTDEALPTTGTESYLLIIAGGTLLAAGFLVLRSRREHADR